MFKVYVYQVIVNANFASYMNYYSLIWQQILFLSFFFIVEYIAKLNKDNKIRYYIGLTKREKEHNGHICNGIATTAKVKIALNENININYYKRKKLANYDNRNYVY